MELTFRLMRYLRRERSSVSIFRSVTSSRRWSTFLRYAAGSLVATGCSEVVLVAGYGLLGLGPQAEDVVEWVAGEVPN